VREEFVLERRRLLWSGARISPLPVSAGLGNRHDPMASVSTVAQHMPLDTAAAEPLDEPPGMYAAFQGFFIYPK
jgi:hypothetical protein